MAQAGRTLFTAKDATAPLRSALIAPHKLGDDPLRQSGDSPLNKSLTIVLPVHNGESRLRSCVREILEVASELTSAFGILIVDDGSTDATFEVAEELSARYPQVSVRRHRFHRGLGPTIEYVQRTVRSDAVMIHDGVTPIDANQMRNEWRRWIAKSQGAATACDALSSQGDICDFANLPAIHAAMERAHSRMLGFQLVTPAQFNDATTYDNCEPPKAPRTDAARVQRADVGKIPVLPRPKFIRAIAEFAIGE
jgi:hypothetical protein